MKWAALALVLLLARSSSGNPVSASGQGASFNTSGSGTSVVDNALIRGDASVSPTALQGGGCTEDDNGGVDCPAHPTNGGKMTLKEGADDGTNVMSIAVPDTGCDVDQAYTANAHCVPSFITPRYRVTLFEDFIGTVGVAPGMGSFGFQTLTIAGATCTQTSDVTVYNRPGVLKQANNAAANAGCVTAAGTGTYAALIALTTNPGWTLEWAAGINSVTNTDFFVGMASTTGGTGALGTYADVIGVRALAGTDTFYTCLACLASTCSTTVSAVAIDTAIHRFALDMSASGTFRCSVDGGTAVTVTGANVPGAGIIMRPIAGEKTTNATVQSMDIDYAYLDLPVSR